jgi:Predicted membrane protein (DUF2306)
MPAPSTPATSPVYVPAPDTSESLSKPIWTVLLVLCLIAVAAALRRIVALTFPQTSPGVPQLAALDQVFASHRALTLIHILPALAFILILPAWFAMRVRANPATHLRVTRALLLLGAVTGITALLMSRYPVGGVNETAATLLYGTLFLFSLGRAALLLRRGNLPLHRNWMMRAIAILLGIATTRPIMGAFFATQPLTHLTPHQFFGTAFWLGFSLTYIAGEAYLRSHPTTA